MVDKEVEAEGLKQVAQISPTINKESVCVLTGEKIPIKVQDDEYFSEGGISRLFRLFGKNTDEDDNEILDNEMPDMSQQTAPGSPTYISIIYLY